MQIFNSASSTLENSHLPLFRQIALLEIYTNSWATPQMQFLAAALSEWRGNDTTTKLITYLR
ncbi:hypothetical protein [Streptomyces sp. BF23-19]|uniref:hypothetical protein n=1 Tax=unclassified Streptomyces TaxID=2593676 RepID=UPI0034E46E2E